MLRLFAFLLAASTVMAQDSKSVIDPPAKPPEILDTFKPITIPDRLFSPEVIFAANGGPFLAVGGREGQTTAYSIVSLKDNNKVLATLQDKDMDKPILSSDGKRLAAIPRFGARNHSVTIYSVEKKAVETKIDLTDRPDRILFVTNDQILVEHAFKKLIHIYDITTGKSTVKIDSDRFTHAPALAVSPGGKWLAINRNDHIAAVNIKDGNEVRLMDHPKPDQQAISPHALAFSADGKLLAMLGDHHGKTYACILNLATGGPSEPRLIDGLRHGRNTTIEGTPDGLGWLIGGEIMLEATSGQLLYRRENPNGWQSSGRALSLYQFLFVETHQKKGIFAYKTDKAKVDSAQTAAKSGGNAMDALRGNVLKANTAAAKTITLPALAPWKGASVTPTRSVAGAGTNLPFPSHETGLMYVGGPDASILAVEKLKQGANPNDPGSSAFGVVDLKSGRTLGLGKFDLPGKLLDVSPDGKSILATDAAKPERLDVFGNDGKPKQAWRPYEGEPEKGIAFAAFIDDNRVATLSTSGAMAVWNAADAKAEAILRDQTLKVSRLSPDRKVLAALTTEGLRLLSAVTLEPLGDTQPASLGTPKAVAFKATGGDVAGLYQSPDRINFMIQVWDIASGKVKATLRFPYQPGFKEETDFQFAGDYFLIDGRMLIDAKDGKHIWNYTTNAFMRSRVMNSPDERFMYPANPNFNQPSKLASTLMPDSQTAAAIQAVRTSTDFVLKPKSTIKLTCQADGQHAADVEKRFKTAVETAIRSSKHLLGDGDLEYTARMSEESTGKTEQYRMFGTGQTIDVPMYQITLEATLMQNGRAVYKTSFKVGMAQFMVSIPRGENDIPAYLRKQMWENAAGRAASLGLPESIARTPIGLISLPGTTVLDDRGATVMTYKSPE